MSIATLIADPTLPLPAHMSKRQAAQVATLRDAYRVAMSARPARAKLAAPEAVAALMAPIVGALSVERLYLLPLDCQSRLIGEPVIVSQGSADGTDADARTIMRAVLLAGAITFVLVHNHPTGDAAPSAADRAVTARLWTAANTVGAPLVDHVVIGSAGAHASIRRLHPECFR